MKTIITIFILISLFSLISSYISLVSNYKRVSLLKMTSLTENEIKFGGIQHCGVIVSNVELSKKYYMDVFGFIDETQLRPTTLPFQGAFLKVGNDQIHLMELPNPDPTEGRPAHGGRDRHIAFNMNNIDLIKNKLEKLNIAFTLSSSGRRALFCRDPDGNAFEFIEDVSLA